eukprot:c17430_g1_i1 orf=1-1092(-)
MSQKQAMPTTDASLHKLWSMAHRVVLVLVIQMLLCNRVNAQLFLNDVEALKSVSSMLTDMLGSSFFASWDFSKDPCSFSGVLCDVVDGVERVTVLTLGDASSNSRGLRGTLSSALGNLAALQQLTLVPGQVIGPIPSTIGVIVNLQFIGLSKNYLSGSIPDSFAELHQLVTLDLSYNRLTGSIPEAVAALPKLASLVLTRNLLTGSIPTITSPLSHLDLKHNKFVGTLPAFPISINYLSLSNNQLSGPLDNIADLANLVYLDLSFNRFSGSVPSAIFGFKLNSLQLQRNQLSGPVRPSELVVIPTIDLSFNNLSGVISPFLAFAHNIYLNNNKFVGALPQEFVNELLSASIQILYLQHNFLTSF